MDRLELMDMFEKDMRALGEFDSRPSGYDRFKNDPETYKYIYAEAQFKIWLAGRNSVENTDA